MLSNSGKHDQFSKQTEKFCRGEKKNREGRDGREMETDRKLCNEKPQRYFVAV